MDIIFNLFKIKFKKLDSLISENTNIAPDSRVNVFINLDNIFNKIADTRVEDYLEVRDTKRCYEFISNIINIASHYRLFFTKNKIYSRIYLYTSFPNTIRYKNCQVNEEYRSYYMNKIFNNPNNQLLGRTIKENIELAKIFTTFINGVYLVYSNSVETSLVPAIINEYNNDNYLNFILSNDPYEYQYVNKGFYVLHPKQEESFIVTSKNLWSKLGKGKISEDSLNPAMLPLVLSVLGDKYRSMDKVKGMGLKTIVKAIRLAIDKNVISRDASHVSTLLPLIKEDYVDTVVKNYACTDLDVQLSYTYPVLRNLITNQLVDKFDNQGLMKLNNEYFREHPINLMEITEANNLLKTRNVF